MSSVSSYHPRLSPIRAHRVAPEPAQLVVVVYFSSLSKFDRPGHVSKVLANICPQSTALPAPVPPPAHRVAPEPFAHVQLVVIVQFFVAISDGARTMFSLHS